MAEEVSAFQTAPLTFEIRGPIGNSPEFVQKALSKVKKAVVNDASASKIEGHYQFGGGDLIVPFSVSIEEPSENLTILSLAFSGNDPEWRTDLIQEQFGEAVAQAAASSQSAAKLREPKPLKVGPQSKQQTTQRQASPHASTVRPADYKTTSGLGSLFAIIGWLGVALSVIGGLAAAQTLGLPGIATGFIAALFCLMIVAAGQLLRAQVEVANNSRLILLQLETLNSDRD